MRDPRHDNLFEPLQIGPVTTKNRFYQVPHCTGMGWRRPQTLAAMRAVKAEGGWGVVNTEYCSIHPTSDDDSYPFATLWDDGDIRAHRLMTDAVHAHGALAGVELCAGGGFTANLGTRIPPIGTQDRPVTNANIPHPVQPRRADRQDIRDIRRWHRDAAYRALEAEFDIVYVYANHGYLLSNFLNPATNDRGDEYGGSLENRLRLIRELLEETRDAIGHKAAVACRFSVDLGDPESFDAFSLLSELPDLWDLTVPDYDVEMGPSRFIKEGALAPDVARAKSLTTKPVVAVGRFTSPDTMASQLRSGTQDLIGAARPSIADPFLPKKIEEGRSDDIRECIGCNICYAHNSLGVPIRCTQNPTMGEEWRLGWHPERVTAAPDSERVLVVGAGPTGLEAARALGARGYTVLLAEATRDLGGRVSRESRLPGLSEWARVRDWRVGQIDKMTNVEIYRESALTADDVLSLEVQHVLIATGARWATDGIGLSRDTALPVEGGRVISPDAILNGEPVDAGRIAIFDDEHYYLGSVLALELRRRGHEVVLITPQGRAGMWMTYTEELYASTARLLDAGIEIVTNKVVERLTATDTVVSCVFSGQESRVACDALLPVTRRIPVSSLYDALSADADAVKSAGIQTLRRIGDAEAPSIIAAAVHAGHRAAMDIGSPGDVYDRYGTRERIDVP